MKSLILIILQDYLRISPSKYATITTAKAEAVAAVTTTIAAAATN